MTYINIVWTNQEGTEEKVCTDSINDDVRKKIINQGTKQYTPIFTTPEDFSEIQDIYKTLGFPDINKPVILLFRGQKLETADRDKFTSFRINADPIEGRIYGVEEVDRILEVVEKARKIGIAHDQDQVLPEGFLGSESEVSFKFSEDDPKKYFKAFMEFAAYGSNGNGEEIEAYLSKLFEKFITKSGRQQQEKEIKTKFGIPDHKFGEIFLYDGTINIEKLQKYSKEKLQESGITNENQSIYHGKHEFTAEIRRDGRLYIKSNGNFEGGLFANGVATIFGGFDSTQNDLLQKFITNPDQKIEGLDVRLITAVTESMHQLKQIQKTDDLKNKNVVHRGVFLEKPPSPTPAPVAAQPAAQGPEVTVEI
jgi:hypothetical protein